MVANPARRVFSITTYMVVAVILVHMAILPFLYNEITSQYKVASYEQYLGHVTEVGGLLADVLSTKSITQDLDDIRSVLETSVLGGNIQYIEVMSDDGLLIRPRADVFQISGKFLEDTAVGTHGDDVYYFDVPVYFKDDSSVISRLRLGFDESAVINDYKAVKEKIIYALMIYLLIIVLIIAAITRLIHKPLHQLRARSKDIANGNVEVPLGVSSGLREIQYLANDLELMRLSLVDIAAHMQHKAAHDELTGLPNRYLFNDRLEQAIARSVRDNSSFAILLLDLDRFKEINDTLGHGVGDEVLKIVSRRMQTGLRESDTVARIGGDEFSFILMGADQQDAEKIASKVVDLIQPKFAVNNHLLKIGSSIGISIYPEHGDEAGLLMSRADVAMYSAKQNNLSLVAYNPEMDRDHYQSLMLANDLKSSISAGNFSALYQPKINVSTGKPCGCELLLRWNHPKLGVIYPDKFIPLAERENLTGELTGSIVRNNLGAFQELVEIDPGFHVSINVSPVDLLDNTLFDLIIDALEQVNFPRENLYIEVTENAIMKNPSRSVEILGMFKDAGIKISIDDFGTGYSSLSYLQKFPISELKIDKSFVRELSQWSVNFPIVSATITMAHDLGISVVAEGVEDEAVLQLLASMGCDHAQGYHFTKPLGFSDMKRWFKTMSV